MKTKHTKGEWKLNEHNPCYVDLPNNLRLIHSIPMGTKLIDGEIKANAKLIASAPELLEMLQKAISETALSQSLVDTAFRIDAKKLIKKATQ